MLIEDIQEIDIVENVEQLKGRINITISNISKKKAFIETIISIVIKEKLIHWTITQNSWSDNKISIIYINS